MTVADYLIDTSALVRVLLGQTTAEWDDRIGAGLVAICDIIELEVLYSARSAADRGKLKALFDAQYGWCRMPDGIYRRSRVVQEQLTAKGEHRSAAPSTSSWPPPPRKPVSPCSTMTGTSTPSPGRRDSPCA